MGTIKEIQNKDNSVSFKAIVRYKGIFTTKTFRVKANKKKTTENEARMWMLDIETKIDQGIYKQEYKRYNFTVKEAIDKYINDGNPKKLKTTKSDHIRALNWFKKEIGSIPLKLLVRSDIKKCRNKLMQKHKEVSIGDGKVKILEDLITNSTVNRYLAYFSTFLSYCVFEYEIIETNPMIGAKLKLPENEPRKKWLSKLQDRLKLMESCKDYSQDLYIIVFIALTIGARKSEILELKWKHIDLENKAIYLIDTKNKEDRTLPIPDILYDKLISLKENCNIRYIKNDFVFINLKGEPNEYLIQKIFPKIIKALDIEKIVFHELRHTYTSIGSLLGINSDIIDKITGHKNGRMTARYTHADCESLREPMNKIANYMVGIDQQATTSHIYN